ncbi:MAG: tyrosine-type recombinase/integrase [bacterium]
MSNVRYLSYQQYQQLLSVIDNFMHKLIIRLGFESLCRITEITNLTLKDLNFDDAEIYVKPELTKTGVGGWIEISEELMNDIKSWLISEKRIKVRSCEVIEPDSHLFQPRQAREINGSFVRKYTRHRLRQIFNKYVEKAGLQELRGEDSYGDPLRTYTFHSLRHSGIMFMIHDLKLPLDVVRAKSRHTSLAGLSHYAKPSRSLVRAEVRNARKKFKHDFNLE